MAEARSGSDQPRDLPSAALILALTAATPLLRVLCEITDPKRADQQTVHRLARGLLNEATRIIARTD